MNSFFFTGRLTRDPERRETQSGKTLTVITLAVSRDNTRNEADFIPLTAWGNLSDRMQSYGSKGRLLEVEGYVRVKPFSAGPGGLPPPARLMPYPRRLIPWPPLSAWLTTASSPKPPPCATPTCNDTGRTPRLIASWA